MTHTKAKEHGVGASDGQDAVQRFAARALIADLDKQADRLFFVIDGWAAHARTLRDERRQIMRLYLPGDHIDLVSISGASNGNMVTAVSQLTVQQMSLADAAKQGETLARQLARTAQIQAEWLVNLGRKNATEHIAHLLCELAVRQGLWNAQPITFDCPLTQVDLADICGLTAVHVNRTLQDMRTSGLITTSRRKLTITDPLALAEAGEFDDYYLSRAPSAGKFSKV